MADRSSADYLGVSSVPPTPPQSRSDILDSGSSSLSASGKVLAVTNLLDGIDWYSIPEREYRSTTTYEMGSTGHVVGLDFVDEKTVVAGHVDGHLIFADSRTSNNPSELTFPQARPRP